MPNVLIIDDTQEVREVIVTTLNHFGFSTREATDGRSGIQMALAEKPDLIICDVRMPGLDGYRTLAAIRDEPAIANVPFIFLTAAMAMQDLRRGMVLGADDYLTKPFTPEELLEAVTTRLDRCAEFKSEMYKRAEKLSGNVAHLFTQELSGSLDGILGLTSEMMADYHKLAPEAILANARHINESAARINQLAKSLG